MATAEKVRHMNATELLEAVVDPGSFACWDTEPEQPVLSAEYARDLARARERSGADESVITGAGLIRGRRVALIVSEFSFLAGSIGHAAAQRIVAAVERATAEGLPLLAGPASGGTRMQEGTLAFLSMVKITGAVRAHRQAGLPYLVYLRHPTTGGVMASWGSLGHINVAEPGALLGFLGPRVYEALHGEAFPEDVQVAENLFNKGLIDGVVEPGDLADLVGRALDILAANGGAGAGGSIAASVPAPPPAPPETLDTRPSTADAWTSIEISRRSRRPDLRQLLKFGATDALPLNGTGQGEKDPGLLLALARFGAQPCIVLGHARPLRKDAAGMGPGSLREARRGMKLAEELRLPLLTVIDTAGAALSQEAEEGGLAGEIARSLHELIGLESPSVSVLLGQGAGGGALALLPADRTIAAQHSWLSPLPPEGASAIVHRTTAFAPAMAQAQGVNVAALYANGLVDHIVDERGDASLEPRGFCTRMARAIEYELASVARVPVPELVAARARKFASLGSR
ncbi:acetyl-CoA carboxylase carboxyltransferase subunit alpha/beta [Arthrobacter sp. ISL-85]|uniref:carboxyl transferase domain-containing protein n=1 Tax=Arthrobacter sp. ISL-85 TaxID=2819115 RepID=UPI001BE528C4|nr:carboxyl transferase domain-containing protein [Arthrobacter sp. ISL-85]MBT2565016.1 acetyl-CoA carboxylase carboxyltransferase subunit alpha/beta [Arthrobacter sp. ISL-85]